MHPCIHSTCLIRFLCCFSFCTFMSPLICLGQHTFTYKYVWFETVFVFALCFSLAWMIFFFFSFHLCFSVYSFFDQQLEHASRVQILWYAMHNMTYSIHLDKTGWRCKPFSYTYIQTWPKNCMAKCHRSISMSIKHFDSGYCLGFFPILIIVAVPPFHAGHLNFSARRIFNSISKFEKQREFENCFFFSSLAFGWAFGSQCIWKNTAKLIYEAENVWHSA